MDVMQRRGAYLVGLSVMKVGNFVQSNVQISFELSMAFPDLLASWPLKRPFYPC